MKSILLKILFGLMMFVLWFLFCVGLGLSQSADAAEIDANAWTNTEITKQVIASSLLVADWSQTIDLSQRHGYFETNLILGRHPNEKRIDAYFGAVIIGQIIAADILPRKYRNYLINSTIGIEAIAVSHNAYIGINFKI